MSAKTQSGKHITLKPVPGGLMIAFPHGGYQKPMTARDLLWLALNCIQAALEMKETN